MTSQVSDLTSRPLLLRRFPLAWFWPYRVPRWRWQQGGKHRPKWTNWPGIYA